MESVRFKRVASSGGKVHLVYPRSQCGVLKGFSQKGNGEQREEGTWRKKGLPPSENFLKKKKKKKRGGMVSTAKTGKTINGRVIFYCQCLSILSSELERYERDSGACNKQNHESIRKKDT